MLLKEAAALLSRFWRGFGRLGERGPADGPPLMVIPGFLATDRTTLGLQRAFAEAGYRVAGWGLGFNRGAREDTVERLVRQLEHFAQGRKVVLVGWSLGGLYARELAKARPELVEKVVTLASPFSGDPHNNNVWRLYELVAGHPVDKPPIDGDPAAKPPVPTLAIWSRNDGIVAPAAARGKPGERDAEQELDCGHMGFAVGGRCYPRIVEAVRNFASS
ncbi:MAG TPA: alpha/beta hydrolase [Allosphingosinicella sp.]|jgi:pimeloyl-ACP methyl ester carboxylesterase|nr:alpha/beta hydrolase [Allosphingosinicella sp.]